MRHLLQQILLELRPTRVWENLCNVISIIPIVWNNYHWDYSGALYLLKWKFDKMAPAIEHGNCMGGEARAREIRIAAELIDRILNEEIDDEYSDALSEWWESRVETEQPNDLVRMDFPDNRKLELTLNRCRIRKERKEKYYWDYLFKLMHNNMRRWWD